MKNRILSITRNSVPYVKELRPFAKSVVGCIIMQQLDYWFEKYPDGFYKFLAPAPNNRHYRTSKSWGEELGVSEKEFGTAFQHIGVAYSSKTQFEEAADKFQGKFYCSYFDRKEGTTHYFRNHELVDAVLDAMCQNEGTGVYSNRPMGVYRNSQPEFTETPDGSFPNDLHIRNAYARTETTEENKEEKNNVCVGETKNFAYEIPSVESPVAMAIRKICKRTTLALSSRDQLALIEVLRGLQLENATVEQVQEFGRKVKLHWIGKGNNTPKIPQVLEFWEEVLEIDETLTGESDANGNRANGNGPGAGQRRTLTDRGNHDGGNRPRPNSSSARWQALRELGIDE